MFKQSTTTGRVLRPSRSLVRYTIRPLLAATLAVGLLAGTTGATKAATGVVGWHSRTEVTCFEGKRMLVQVPSVNAAYVQSPSNIVTVGGSFGGGTNYQQVGVRFWLIKLNPGTRAWEYTDQNRDGRFDYTAEFRIWTTSDGPLVGYNWWNVDANRSPQAYDMTFYVRDAGAYATVTQYFWYTNGQQSGYDLLASWNHYVAEYFYVAKPYCTY